MATLPYERKSTKHQTPNGYSSLGRKSEGELSEEGTRFERETVIKQMGSSHLIRSQRLQKQVNLQTWDGLRLFPTSVSAFVTKFGEICAALCCVCIYFFFPIQLLSFESLKLVFVCLFVYFGIFGFVNGGVVLGMVVGGFKEEKGTLSNSEVWLCVVGLTDPVIVFLYNE